ncbi:hypothetical protein Bbelb_110880 [Branchiostoma belcheri]|nr:hypothetical protein Bbelb_110880 [Branchiostoma belcheri]
MEVMKTQTEDIFRHLLHHRDPNVFPRSWRWENRAIYRKVVQVSKDVTEREEWADLVCCFASTTTTTNGSSRLRHLLENVLSEDGLNWGHIITAMIFALDVHIKLHESQTSQGNAMCSELADLMCATAGRWLLKHGGWNGMIDPAEPSIFVTVVNLICHETVKGGGREYEVITVPSGYYKNISQLVEVLNEAAAVRYTMNLFKQHDMFSYNTIAKRVTMVLPPMVTNLPTAETYLIGPLAEKLGWKTKSSISGSRIQAPHPPDWNAGLESLYVYCDLIQDRLVGGGEDDSAVNHVIHVPQYLPLARRRFETIQVNIMDHFGQVVPFERGRLIRGAKAVGKQALRCGIDLAQDVLNGQGVKRAAKRRAIELGKKSKDKYKVDAITSEHKRGDQRQENFKTEKSSKTSIVDGRWVEYHPVSSLTEMSPIEFDVQGAGEEYTDLSQTQLYVRAKIVTANGGDLSEGEKTPRDAFTWSTLSRPARVLWLVNLLSTYQLSIESRLNKESAKYPLRRIQVKPFTIPQGNHTVSNDNLFLGQIPKRLAIALVPHKALTPKFEGGHFIRSYFNLFGPIGKLGQDSGNQIARDTFDKGYTRGDPKVLGLSQKT